MNAKTFPLLVFFSFSFLAIADQPVTAPRDLLILNSYHQGFKWTDNMVAGIRDGIKGTEGTAPTLHIEYLDTKRRMADLGYYDRFADLLAYKVRQSPPDIVIDTDNDALSFVIDRHQTLFPGVPVVFCGVNFFEPAMLKGDPLVTGIVEAPDIKGTLDLILLMRRNTKEIVFISDKTTTGLRNRLSAEAASAEYAPRVSFRFVDCPDYTVAELERILSRLTFDTAVFFLDAFRDSSGAYLDPDIYLPVFCAASKVPVFTHTDLYFELGPAAGSMNLGFYHGQAAARIASRILNGETVRDIKVETHSPARLAFDHAVLGRFGLGGFPIPEGSVEVNKPFSFMTEYRGPVIAVAIVFALLTALTIGLAITLKAKAGTEAALKESERYAKTVFDAVNETIVIFEAGTWCIKDINRIASTMFGIPKEDVRGLPLKRFIRAPSPFSWLEAQKQLEYALLGETRPVEWIFRNKYGKKLIMEIRLTKATVPDGDIVIASARDISERKAAEEIIQASLKEKEILLREIHHRVKNNFQIIESLFRLGDAYVVDEALRLTLLEPRSRIHAMALVHEHLYQSSNLGSIPLDEYLMNLASQLQSAYGGSGGRTRIDYALEPFVIDLDSAIPCGLAVNELVTNALKYGADAHGDCMIRIEARQEGEKAILTIADEGKGIPAEHMGGKDTSLGITLVKLLASQLGGDITFKAENGTVATFSFPLKRDGIQGNRGESV